MISAKLPENAHIRVVAPARSMSFIKPSIIPYATQTLEKQGYTVTFGKHVDEINDFDSSSIEARIADLHEAFADTSVNGILTVLGGYNSNQLLRYLDYDLIGNNPKVLCGYSDITSILNAINAKTGLITYLGPHFTSWGMLEGFNYSKEYFLKACASTLPYELLPSKEWSDDTWFLDQNNRTFIKNEEYWSIQSGEAEGRIHGGNLSTYVLLAGTEYEKPLANSILFLEATREVTPQLFESKIASFANHRGINEIKGIVVGRFHHDSGITKGILKKIFAVYPEFRKIPILGNADFGHTTPNATIPLGGTCQIFASEELSTIKICTH